VTDLPLHGVAIYNPDLLSKQELIAQFVARRPLLARLLDDLGREGTTQHHLLVGQRGMGKTTLLRRVRYAIEDDPELSAVWVPLTFPEEQYNVARLSDFYLNCIDALGDALERMGRPREARELDEAREKLPDRDEQERAKRAFEVLLYGADRVKRRLLLLVDNIDLIFERLKGEGWTIRERLSGEPRLLFVGASSVMLETTYEYKEPFYEFFQVHELGGLGEEETREVLVNLARVGGAPGVAKVVEEDPARIKTLHVLAGGNPRTVVLLYDVIARGGPAGDVRAELERLLDRVTPLYKARFEALPAQAQQVVDAMAIHWDPITAADLAGLARLEVATVSSQLSRLEKQGVVEKAYQIAERFFNIWYLMRASRRIRQRLGWLVEFLRMMYSKEQIRGYVDRYLREDEGRDAEGRQRRAEYGFALARAVDDERLRGALESVSVRALAVDKELRETLGTIIDLEGADAALKPVVDRHTAMVEVREAVFAARVTWEGWDAERFWELLGGSMVMTSIRKADR
jgi:DNA-binding transcriptional ArsR family regulator